MRALFGMLLKDSNIATKTPMSNRLLEYVTMLLLVFPTESKSNDYDGEGPPMV